MGKVKITIKEDKNKPPRQLAYVCPRCGSENIHKLISVSDISGKPSWFTLKLTRIVTESQEYKCSDCKTEFVASISEHRKQRCFKKMLIWMWILPTILSTITIMLYSYVTFPNNPGHMPQTPIDFIFATLVGIVISYWVFVLIFYIMGD